MQVFTDEFADLVESILLNATEGGMSCSNDDLVARLKQQSIEVEKFTLDDLYNLVLAERGQIARKRGVGYHRSGVEKVKRATSGEGRTVDPSTLPEGLAESIANLLSNKFTGATPVKSLSFDYIKAKLEDDFPALVGKNTLVKDCVMTQLADRYESVAGGVKPRKAGPTAKA